MSNERAAQNKSRERAKVVDMAVDATLSRSAAMAILRTGPAIDESGGGGFYNDSDEFVSYWKVGMTVGSAPLKPF